MERPRIGMGKLDGVIQIVLAVGLVAAIIHGCRPRPAESDPLLRRMAESHLTHCTICRANGVTVDDLVGTEDGAPCVASGMTEGDEPEGER